MPTDKEQQAKILLVEDDYALALGTEYSLKAEGYQVVHAINLAQARKHLLTDKEWFSLVLLDVMLPDGNGYTFLEEVRRAEIYVPVIFLTAVAEEANIVQGLDLGADDYVTKPYRVKELLSRIYAALRRERQYRYETDSFGIGHDADEHHKGQIDIEGYRIDFDNFRVYRDGVGIDCTPSEFRLLRELLLHPRQVLSREQLLERIWDVESSFVDDNTLSVYMKRLRDKLPGIKERIHTVRGVGYRFE